MNESGEQMRTLFIVNPISGMDIAAPIRRELLDEISTMRGADAHVLTRPGEANSVAKQAVETGYDRIIVAAGDGTLNEVVNGIGDSDIAVGLVPLGTGNVFASELCLSKDSLARSMSVIQTGKTRRIDLGRAGRRRFLLMAGFGFDAEVVHSVPSRAKGMFGKLAYAPTLVKESVSYQPSDFKLTFEDERTIQVEAYNVIVCNSASYAPNFQLAPDAKTDDGLLDVLVFGNEPAMKLKFLGWVSQSLVSSAVADSSVERYQVRRVRIDADPIVKMQIDGDVRGESGINIEVLPNALNLIVP